jgi:hypothetical protein
MIGITTTTFLSETIETIETIILGIKIIEEKKGGGLGGVM